MSRLTIIAMPKVRSALQRPRNVSTDSPITKSSKAKPAKRRFKLMSESCSFAAAEQLISELEKRYTKAANKKEAAGMKQYMRGQFEFYGIKAPMRRAIDKEVTNEFFPLDVESLRCLLNKCWEKDEREYQHFALDVAKKYKGTLSGDSSAICMDSLELMKTLITTKSWWDTVDLLASNVVGYFAKEHPTAIIPVLDSWITSENMWLRRTAILHQLSYKADTNKDRLFKYCEACCAEREFFIEKAIGWALREYYKTNPKDVTTFVKTNKDKLAKLSVREALKHA